MIEEFKCDQFSMKINTFYPGLYFIIVLIILKIMVAEWPPKYLIPE